MNATIKTYIKSTNLPDGNPYGVTPYKKIDRNSKEFKKLGNMIIGVNREKKVKGNTARVDI